jgi:RimJ/RimL family protein N-acetyltransferase
VDGVVNDAYDIRPMRADEAGRATAFLQAHGAAELSRRLPDYFRWLYLDHPLGTDVRLCVERAGGSIAGMSGFVRTRLGLDGRAILGAFSTNTMVDPAHRRRGLAAELHRQRIRDYDVALSSGQSPANRAVYDALGFVPLGQYRRAVVAPAGPMGGSAGRWLRETASWWRWRRHRRSADAGPIRVDRQTGTLPDIPDSWWRERWPDSVVAPVWTPDQIVWRYARHAYLTYDFCTVHDADGPLGLAVTRHEGHVTIVVDLYGRWRDLPRLLVGLGTAKEGVLTAVYVGQPLDDVFTSAGWSSGDEAMPLLGRSRDDDISSWMADRAWCFYAGESDKDR